MRDHRHRWVLTASALLLLALGAAPQPTTRPGSFQGPAEGVLELPEGSLDGSMAGALLDRSGTRVVFELRARLVAFGVACPACFAGSIEGQLAAGAGRLPDLAVEGFYAGNTIDGTGTFDATILLRSRGGEVPVGDLRGRLVDPPSVPGPGVFEGTWRLRADLPRG